MKQIGIPEIRLNNGVMMPVLGLGTYKLRGNDCINSVKDAINLGYTHIDTAEYYENFKEIGEAIKDIDRERLFITSKVWYDDLKYDSVISACKKALSEMQIHYLDLFMIHWPNKNIDLKETLSAFKKLHDDGLFRTFGVSNFMVSHLKKVLEYCNEIDLPICVNQVEFHPFLKQNEVLEFCNKNEIKVTAYSPIARGKVNDNIIIRNIALKYNKSPMQISLRWLLDKGIIVIPKATSMEHLISNMDVFDFKLENDEINKIDSIKEVIRFALPSFNEFNF